MKRVTERADLACKQVPQFISGCRQFEGEDLSKYKAPATFPGLIEHSESQTLSEFFITDIDIAYPSRLQRAHDGQCSAPEAMGQGAGQRAPGLGRDE